MLIHWLWFAGLSGLNSVQKQMLLTRFSDPEELFSYDEDKLQGIEGITPELCKLLQQKDLTQPYEILKTCNEKKIGILTIGDAAYPGRLRNIEDPPLVLYYKGVLPDFQSVPAVGVVGTRKASAYGLTIARRISRQIAACGALVVSGGAFGVDTMAMQGALDAGSPVVGVLGCGVDVVYPKSNAHLFAAVEESGCLISEYPPGTRPYSWQFPRRNRIISGMSNGVLVVEAPEKSGALITARNALEQGRDVFVVPGNIDVVTCTGSNALLQEGASAVFSGWDAVKEYAALYPGKIEKREPVLMLAEEETTVAEASKRPMAKVANPKVPGLRDKKDIDNPKTSQYSGITDSLPVLTQEEEAVVRCMGCDPAPIDEVIANTELPAGKVLGILTTLTLKGIVIQYPGRQIALKQEIPTTGGKHG